MRSTYQNSYSNSVLLSERTSTALGGEDYRYGFQNQEMDDEVAGKGNSYTAEFWQYDSRLGRRWNIDPIFKEHESPYACFANNPIWFSDPDGADTSDLHKLNTKMSELEQMSKNLRVTEKEIWKLIYSHEQNVKKISNIETNQEISENSAKGNIVPQGKVVIAVNEFNSYFIPILKGKLVLETQEINKAIDRYNKDIELYNDCKLAMKAEMSICDAMRLSYSDKIYTVNKNTTSEPAAVRFDIDGEIHRYGITKKDSPKIYVNLPKLFKINPIKYSPYTADDLNQELLNQGLNAIEKKIKK